MDCNPYLHLKLALITLLALIYARQRTMDFDPIRIKLKRIYAKQANRSHMCKQKDPVSLPEFQHLAGGDVIPMSPAGKQGLRVQAFAPHHWLLWGSAAGDSTWYWGLEPVAAQQTRLITRVRVRYHWTSPTILLSLLVEFADMVLLRQCWRGIQRRAERARRPPTAPR